jgi:hypothetical protein
MKKLAALLASSAALAACHDPTTAAAPGESGPVAAPNLARASAAQRIPGSYIVVFRDDAAGDPTELADALVARHGGRT